MLAQGCKASQRKSQARIILEVGWTSGFSHCNLLILQVGPLKLREGKHHTQGQTASWQESQVSQPSHCTNDFFCPALLQLRGYTSPLYLTGRKQNAREALDQTKRQVINNSCDLLSVYSARVWAKCFVRTFKPHSVWHCCPLCRRGRCDSGS